MAPLKECGDRHARHEALFDKLFARKLGTFTFIIVTSLFGSALGYVAHDVSTISAANAAQDAQLAKNTVIIQTLDERLKDMSNKIDRLVEKSSK